MGEVLVALLNAIFGGRQAVPQRNKAAEASESTVESKEGCLLGEVSLRPCAARGKRWCEPGRENRDHPLCKAG